MDIATYRRQCGEVSNKIDAIEVKSRSENEERSRLWALQREAEFNSPEYLELDVEINRLDGLRREYLTELEQLSAELDRLRREREIGFDFTRPGRRFMNRLLPPLVTARKEVKYYDGDRDRRTAFVASLVMIAVSVGLFCLLLMIGPGAGYFGGLALSNTVFPTTGSAAYIWAVIGGVVFAVSTPLMYLTRFHHDRMLGIWQRYLQDAEYWSFGQRLKAAAVYAVATPWTIWVPVLSVPFRFFLMLTGQVIYLRQMKKQDTGGELIDNATYKKALRKSEYACVVAAVTVITLVGTLMLVAGILALILL